MWNDEEPTKRSLGIREKKILYERSGHKCESCEKQIDFLEMQVGHKKAASKGGSATLRNCVALCYKCNNLMGTDSWSVFLKKIGQLRFTYPAKLKRSAQMRKPTTGKAEG